jgi:type I restriction enzyme, R subunit
MASPFYESDYERIFMEKLQASGWTPKFGGSIARRIDDALIESDLKAFLRSRYAERGLTEDEYETAIARVRNVSGSTGYRAMANAVDLVRDGYDFVPKTPGLAPFKLEYVDFVHPERNLFKAVNQYEYHEGRKQRIPDIVLFVNGIPLVIVELKNPMNPVATIKTAHAQIRNRYWTDVPSFMKYCPLAIISDGSNTRLGTSVSPFEFFYAWKKVENGDSAGAGLGELDSLIGGALKPERLLEIYRDYLYFPDPAAGEEKETAVVCRYPQFFAARKLQAHVLQALRGACGTGDGKGGLYFGATGCGKTYTMLFLSRLLALRCRDRLGSPTILLIVDREDLESQAGKLFCNSKQYLCDENVRVFESRNDLAKEMTARKSGGFYITTIQKFTESTGVLTDRANVICLSDEAHRTQNNIGSQLKTTGLGAFVSYGFAKYLRDALPNATYCGFTGTPIDEAVHVFGGIVDEYTMRQAQADGITVPITYDPRLARVFLDRSKAEAIEKYYKQCEKDGVSEEDIALSKKAMSEIGQIIGDPDRLARVAKDIVEDYEKRVDDKPGLRQKAMITCSDRDLAWELYKQIQKLRPHWCEPRKALDATGMSEDELEKLNEVAYLNLVATRDEKKDPTELYKLLGDPQDRKELAEEFKKDESNFRIAIVVDMWITGFDCPSLTFLYNDKPLQKHTLIQTISRVNRRYKTKDCGVIIDYIGIRDKMREAIKQYGGGEGGEGGSCERDVESARKILMTELQILRELCHGLDFNAFFNGSALDKLQFLQAGAEYVLALTFKSGDPQAVSFQTRFVSHVKRLRAAYAICNPAGVLSDAEAAWSQCFMGVCSFLLKMVAPRHETERMNREVEKMVQEALLCSGVESVLGKEEGSDELILGDEFMKELAEVTMPNTKFQMLLKLLKRVIRDYAKTNKVRAEYFEKLLEATVEEYNTRDKLTFANQVANDTVNAVSFVVNQKIEELSAQLISLLKGVETDKAEFKKLGISFEEKAFYDILVNLREAHGFDYPDGRCKELAQKIKNLIDGTSIYADWLNNDNLKAQLSTDLTTLLYTEGYPPDWDEEVFARVLEQMENYKKHQADDAA